MKTKAKFIWAYIFSAIFFVAFLCLAVLIGLKHNFKIDKFVEILAGHRTQSATKFFKIFTYLGSIYVLAAISLICLAAFKNKKDGLFVVCNLGLCAICSTLVKYIVRRARPVWQLVKETGFSFPSAHAMLSVAVYVALIYLACKHLNSKPLKIFVAAFLAIVIFVVGFSRNYLGVHYVTDIVGGMLFGLAITLANIAIYENLINKKHIYSKKQ